MAFPPVGVGAQAYDYSLVSDGTTVSGYDRSGKLVSRGADGGAVLTAIFAALPAAGGAIGFRNDGLPFPWSTTPALPGGVTSKLRLDGNGARIQLSASAPRFLDFTAAADAAHTTWQHLEFLNFVIDANNIGGKHHVFLGTYVNGVVTQHVNLNDLIFENITLVNVPVDPTTTNHRLGLWLVSRQASANEATQDSILGVKVNGWYQYGGNAAIGIAGNGGSLGAPDLNVLVDNYEIDDWYHSLLTAPTSSFASSHIQVVGRAIGGPIGGYIGNGYGEFSGDVGVEIDQHTCLCENNTVRDSRNACYFTTAFNNPSLGAGTQVTEYRGNRAVFNSLLTGRGFSHRTSSQATPVQLGTIKGSGNVVQVISSGNFTGNTNGWAMYRADDATPAGTLHTSIEWEDFTCLLGGLNYASASSVTQNAIVVWPLTAGVNKVVIRNNEVKWAGVSTGGATLTLCCCSIAGTSLDTTVDGVRGDWSGMTGLGLNGARLLEFGVLGATSVIGNQILEGAKYLNAGDMTGGFGVNLSSANLTLAGQSRVTVQGCDFTAASGITAANAISVLAANKPFVHQRGNKYATTPAPAAFTALVTATGKVLGVCWDSMVTFTQGSGAGITAIDYSTNGGTTYTNFLTQGAGALPAGFAQSLGPLPTDALIKVTFATTQPTITLVPVNP